MQSAARYGRRIMERQAITQPDAPRAAVVRYVVPPGCHLRP